MPPPTRTRATVVAVLTLLGSLLLAVAPMGGADASSDKGVVTGVLKFPQKDHPKVQLLWFDKSWKFLGKKAAGGGSYAVNLAPGTYHLQFVDQRPSYQIEKYAPTDVQVTVRAGSPTIRNVTMTRGGYVTGTIRTGDGKPAKDARVVAANRAEQSFETTANAQGQFAVGGLPKGKYSVFTWDKKKQWVGKSAWAGAVKPRTGQNIAVRLKTRAGALRVLLYTPDGSLGGKTPVTLTSKATGQWWTATAKGGTAVFEGLYPGKYTLKFDGLGIWLPRTGTVASAKVRSGSTDIGKFKISKRGGWLTGRVVDDADSGSPAVGIANAHVSLQTSSGDELASTTSNSNGDFTLAGPLTTRSGLTVVATPPSGGWANAQSSLYCLFTPGSKAPVAVTTGRQSAIGDVALTRSTTAAQPPLCKVS
jgi:hypothetical protein